MPASGANRSWTARSGSLLGSRRPRARQPAQSRARSRASTPRAPQPRATRPSAPSGKSSIHQRARQRSGRHQPTKPEPDRDDASRRQTHRDTTSPDATKLAPRGRLDTPFQSRRPRATSSPSEGPPPPRYNLLHRGGTRKDAPDPRGATNRIGEDAAATRRPHRKHDRERGQDLDAGQHRWRRHASCSRGHTPSVTRPRPAKLARDFTSHHSGRDHALARHRAFHPALRTPDPKTPVVRPT
jgi:hypothetical protein